MDGDDAQHHFDDFIHVDSAKYPKAAECLGKDREPLLTFFDFPAEHGRHIRTTNPIASIGFFSCFLKKISEKL